MTTKEKILKELTENPGVSISGEKLASICNVSRAAIWKAVTALRNEGCNIEGTTNGGYILENRVDIFSEEMFKDYFYNNYPAYKESQIYCFKEIDSTNSFAKRLLSENGSLRDENQNLTEAGKKLHKSIIIAESQTAGRGRSGRTFVSPEKTGIYITLIYAPAGGVSQGTRITAFTAVAICRAIKKIYKIQPSIKWINDIFVEGKKAGGILTEGTASFETGLIESAVIGIGLNISKNPDAFSGDLANIAGSIVQDGQSKVSRIEFAAEVGAQVLSVLEENPGDVLAEYKDYSFIIGNKVVVHSLIDNEKGDYFAKVVDIDENAGLVVETEDGTVKTLVSGEVSLRSSQFTK